MEKSSNQSPTALLQQQIIQKVNLQTIPEALAQHPKLDQVTAFECRICLQTNDQENSELLSPCSCTGSVRYIHSSCFKKWIYKKYQDPIMRKQIIGQVGLKCQICKQNYSYSYSVERKCNDCTMFCKKLKNNEFFLMGILVFIMVDSILLSIAINYAQNDLQDLGFDIRQPRYLLIYVAIFLAVGSLIYAINEFTTFFLLQENIQISPLNKCSPPLHVIKANAQARQAIQYGVQQQSNLRIVGPIGIDGS